MQRKVRPILLILLTLIAASAFTCNAQKFERTTYQTLAASKAVIDTAANDYNSGTLPRTKANYALIAKAQAAQAAAVDSFKAYLYAKASGTENLVALQANVNAAILSVTAAVADINKLKEGSHVNTQ